MKNKCWLLGILLLITGSITAQEVKKIGMIGLDTSHSVAFTKLINRGEDSTLNKSYRIVAAYPQGSRTIKSSYERIPRYIEEVKAEGVEIVSSIAELLKKVDYVLLETNDGRMHPEQALEVFKSGKRCFIDKPLAASLGEAIAIRELAQKYNAPVFSSSTLRYSTKTQAISRGEFGKVMGADCYSPHRVEPTHPDFGFYGIHGVEMLYTVMGTGCRSVSRTATELGDVVVGQWDGGRIGSFRSLIKGKHGYGGTVYLEKKIEPMGGNEGYKALVKEILQFFETGKSPIPVEETIEIFTFMKASNMSRERNGNVVSMDEAYKLGQEDARQLIKELEGK